nr:hypothetical protein [uncultured Oscillibacter sp.]
MNAYIAIGHFKDSENTISVAMTAHTKKDFMADLRGNEFVQYVVLTESMVEKFRAILAADDCFGVFEQVKKLTTNYRVWNEVTDYIEQCFDFIEERLAAAKAQD